MKKHLLLFPFFALIATISIAQTLPNNYLKQVFSNAELAGFSETKIEYLNYITEEGWFITDAPPEKQDWFNSLPYLYERDSHNKTVLTTVFSENNISGFNLLKYNYSIKKYRNAYAIYNSQKVLIIKSHDEITKGYNLYRNNN